MYYTYVSSDVQREMKSYSYGSIMKSTNSRNTYYDHNFQIV